VRRAASFDRTRSYRYSLRREWNPALPSITFVMLNPSTADAKRDDPTIRRCMAFARSWGYGGLEVVNLFAWRASTPAALRTAPDPVGPRNDRVLRAVARSASDVLLAWGNHGSLRGRGETVCEMLVRARTAPLLCLGMTAAGQPRHPLYVRGTTRPSVYLLNMASGPAARTNPA